MIIMVAGARCHWCDIEIFQSLIGRSARDHESCTSF